jgi:hypothetical protein
VSVLDVQRLAERFQACALSREEWTHEAHLAVGLWHVVRYGREEALVRLRAGIRALNESNGVANSATGGYHETITGAYVRLLDAFLAARPAGGADSLQDGCDALLAGPIADRKILLRHYSQGLLMSPHARAEWVEPDLAPLTAVP